MKQVFDPNYPSWLALRHVNEIYSTLLRVMTLPEPHVIIHKEPGEAAYNYFGYTYGFKDINGNIFLEITSARTLDGVNVKVYSRDNQERTFSFNEIGLVEGLQVTLIEEIVAQIEDNETDFIFSEENILNELEADHLSYTDELSYDEKILLCLKRIVSFYALYIHHGGVKVYPWVGEMFDHETREQNFYGFNIDINGIPHDTENKYILNGEATILRITESWALMIDFYRWEGNHPFSAMDDENMLAELMYEVPEKFDREVFVQSVKKFAKSTHDHFKPEKVFGRSLFDFQDYFLNKELSPETATRA